MDHIPDYMLRQIRREHGWSVEDWFKFQWPPLPNKFSIFMLAIVSYTLFTRFYLNEHVDLNQPLFNSLFDILLADIVIYKWYTDSRCMVALKKLRAGKPWKNIKPYEVEPFG